MVLGGTTPCNGKWVESHLSELRCYVQLLQSHSLHLEEVAQKEKRQKGPRTEGRTRTSHPFPVVLLTLNSSQTEEGGETMQLEEGS